MAAGQQWGQEMMVIYKIELVNCQGTGNLVSLSQKLTALNAVRQPSILIEHLACFSQDSNWENRCFEG